MDFHPPGITLPSDSATLAIELAAENARLQILVADLLVKNQQLRVELRAVQRAPAFATQFGRISNN